ncbi:MAG TPA: hypothetical protein VEB21_11785 [Terriglobales bacterium]|nr:hypothetical protein [Terriglobales bacterium]
MTAWRWWWAPLLVPSVALAHGGHHGSLAAELAAVPETLAGMRVEIHKTVAPQVVIDNPTERTLEVLDDRGRAFVRIGPRGVEADLAASAWYRTYSPGLPVPRQQLGPQPRWQRVRSERWFGWFDPRLDPETSAAKKPARWRIPLRVDGRATAIGGVFRERQLRVDKYVSQLTSPAEIAPGIKVRLLPGRAAGLMLESRSTEELTVYGSAGEPFLRIGPQGVEANVRSPTWQRSGRVRAGDLALAGGAGQPLWQRVSQQPRFSWIDPRAAADAPRHWQVPMQLGDQRLEIAGESSPVSRQRN